MKTIAADIPGSTTTILFCVMAALCEGIDLQAAGVAAPGIGAEFKPTPGQFGTFFSASTFGLFLGALMGGWLADRIGRKRVLVISTGLFGLFSLLTAHATDVASLTWARALTGVGLGGSLPMLLALVTESSNAQRQSINVATVYAAMPLGGAAASLLVMLISSGQWRMIFVVGGVIPLLLTPLMAIALPESAVFRRERQTSAFNPGGVGAVFADGRTRPTLLLWVSCFFELLLLYLLLNWLPTLLVSDGFTRVQAAGAQIGFNLGGVLSAVLIGHLLVGRQRNAATLAVFIAMPLLLALLANSPPHFGIVLSVVFALGCAVLAAQAFLYAAAPRVYPARIRGLGVGAAVAIGRIGSIVGPTLGGTLKAAGHGPSQLLMDLLPIVIIGCLCALWLAWELARRRED